MWSKLDKSLREEVDLNEFKSKLKPSFKPKRHKHFNCGSKYGITLLCRLRLGRSFLKAHGFAINLINVCGAELKAHLIICLTVHTSKKVVFAVAELRRQLEFSAERLSDNAKTIKITQFTELLTVISP